MTSITRGLKRPRDTREENGQGGSSFSSTIASHPLPFFRVYVEINLALYMPQHRASLTLILHFISPPSFCFFSFFFRFNTKEEHSKDQIGGKNPARSLSFVPGTRKWKIHIRATRLGSSIGLGFERNGLELTDKFNLLQKLARVKENVNFLSLGIGGVGSLHGSWNNMAYIFEDRKGDAQMREKKKYRRNYIKMICVGK